jgi:hypothetical protein
MTPKTCTTAFLLATAVLAGLSAADVVTSTYSSSSSYEFELEHMPDFDQVRDGLDADSSGDPGGMYCVPTSLTNLLGYIGTHGYPDAGPGSADWEAEEDYELITTYIANMASLAGTSGTSGTSHDDAYDAMVYFLNARVPGVFTVTENMATNTTGPTLRSIVDNDVNGAITSMVYGIYEDIGDDVWGRKVLDRTGGHCVSFTRGYRSGSTREIEYMDPDDNRNSSTQSNFGAESYDVEAVNFVKGSSTWTAWLLGDRTGSRIMRTSGDKYRMIDKVIHVRPRSGYSWDSSEHGWTIVWPGDWEDWMVRPGPIPVPSNLSPGQFTIGPLNSTLWFLDASAEGKIFNVRISNHDVTAMDLPHAANALAFARDHALIVLGDGLLSRLHPHVQSTENAPQPITLQVPTGMQYLAMDDLNDALWLAGSASRDLVRMPQRLDGTPAMVSLPQEFPQNATVAGLAASTIPPWPTVAVLDSDGLVHLYKIGDDALITVGQIWTTGPVSSIQFNDEGDLMAFGEQGMALYRAAPGGQWALVDDHPFGGEQFAANTVMSRNRTNFDINEHGGDEWRQIRDTEATPGDLDGDGTVGIDDLLALIGVFGEQSDTADLNGDGVVGVDDMLTLLGNWTD